MWKCLGCYSIPSASSVLLEVGHTHFGKEGCGFGSRSMVGRGNLGPLGSILHVNHPCLYTFVIHTVAVTVVFLSLCCFQ